MVEEEGYSNRTTMPSNDGGIHVCPAHGLIGDQYIQSKMAGREGKRCQICFLEALDRIGVKRVMELRIGTGMTQ